MDKLAAIRYAKAIFDIAVEKNELEAYNDAARGLLHILEADSDFVAIINHPGIPSSIKITAMESALVGKVPADFIGLFILIVKRGREDILPEIFRHFETLYMEHSRKAVAKLYYPQELPPEKIAEITGILQVKTGKSVEIEKHHDPSLIAGFRVEVGGFVLDASMKNRLAMLKKELLGSH